MEYNSKQLKKIPFPPPKFPHFKCSNYYFVCSNTMFLCISHSHLRRRINSKWISPESRIFGERQGKDSPAQRKFALNLHWNFFFTIYDVRNRKLRLLIYSIGWKRTKMREENSNGAYFCECRYPNVDIPCSVGGWRGMETGCSKNTWYFGHVTADSQPTSGLEQNACHSEN